MGKDDLESLIPLEPSEKKKTGSISSAEDITLTKLEEEILSLLKGRELYGLQISQAYDEASQGKRKLSIGTLYPTLSRLEEKGLVVSRMLERPNDDRGGARRKYFRITNLGIRVLVEAYQFRDRLDNWQPTAP